MGDLDPMAGRASDSAVNSPESSEGHSAGEQESPGGWRLVLASASPRRASLLKQAGYSFEIVSSNVSEEHDPALSAEDAARLLAERKARASAALLAGEPALIIGSDTIVAVGEGPGERLLGKPEDAQEARQMLESLSGTRHRVVTGVCVLRCREFGPDAGEAHVEVERTYVTMRPITPAEVTAYVASGEWEGKAGGYAIQENADAFVTRLEEGGFDNVVGLPVALTQRLLELARCES